MKSKIFTYTIFSALALVMLVGIANAATSNGVTVDVDVTTLNNVTAGETYDFAVTVTNANETASYFDFGTSGWTWKNSSGDEITERQEIANGESANYTATLTIPSSGNKNVIVNAYETDSSDELFDVEQLITLNYAEDENETTEEEPEEIEGCSLESDDDLVVEIDDISVYGFGGEDEDTEWFPLDEVEIEINIENDNSDFDIEDIEVHWGLFNSDNGKWYIEEEENDFDLKDDEEETIIVNFNLDEDVDDLEDGNYVFYVWTEGAYLDDNDADEEIDLCAYDSEDIEIIIENDFVILYDIETADNVDAGDELRITAEVWNVGDDDQEDVYVVVYNSDLELNEKVLIGDVDALESETLDTLVEIPSGAEEGTYTLTLYVYDEDDELYENDYNDEEAEFDVRINVKGSSATSAPTVSIISASLESEAKAGEELVVKAVLANTGSDSESLVLKYSGFENWATADSSQTPVVLGAGESREVTITLNVNDDAVGDKSFTVELSSGTETLSAKTLSVSLEAKSGFSFLEGGLDNKYIWIIGALNVLLVVIIIIVAIKVAMR